MAGIIRSKRWEKLKDKSIVIGIINQGQVMAYDRNEDVRVIYDKGSNSVYLDNNKYYDLNDLALLILYFREYKDEV